MKDNNLAFLRVADNEDLKTLVDYMLPRKGDGFPSSLLGFIDDMSCEINKKHSFRTYYPNRLASMCDDIVDELQKYGGSTINNFFRGGGVQYSEILKDVCTWLNGKKFKINYDEDKSVEENEIELLKAIYLKSLENPNLDESDVRAQAMQLGISSFGSKQAVVAAMQVAISKGLKSYYLMSYSVADIVSDLLLGRGLTTSLSRSISAFAGPIGWALAGLFTIYDLSKPAYRVTVPAVIQIAYMRQKFNSTAYNFTL